MKVREFFPILEWLPRYNKRAFRGDLLGGFTMAVMVVPQGMAVALLAGLPAIYGLYASIVPSLLYAFFGTSRHLSVGPVALVSLLVLTGIGQFAEPGTAEFIGLAITTSLLAGIVQILLGAFRLGFLINFLSHPVISGFTSAAAIIIGLSQVKHLLGVELPRSNRIHEVFGGIIAHIGDVNLPTLLIGLGGIFLILLLRKIWPFLPGPLITIVIGIALVALARLDLYGVAIVGEVPEGLPGFIVPELDYETARMLFPLSLTICIISFIESLAIAKTIEAKQKSYRVVPNQELLALGITKIGGAFFQSYPTTGSFTRSAVNEQSGARTAMSSVITAALVSIILLFFTPLFYYLPKALLASVVIVAVIGLIDYREARFLWRNDRQDFTVLMVTFAATLTLGIQDGVIFGLLLSIALMLYRNSKPHLAVLGRIPGTSAYRNVQRFPNAIQDERVLVVRFDNQLYFGNANYFRDSIEEVVHERGDRLEVLVLDASSIHDIDSSGIHAFKDVVRFLKTHKIDFYLSGVIGPVRDILHKTGLMKRIGKDHQFLLVEQAVQAYYESHPESPVAYQADKALQTNLPEFGKSPTEDTED